MTRTSARLLLTILFLSCAAGSLHASTSVAGGTIAANTTWGTSGSPYILNGDVVVAVGVTLTVAPGVTVQSDGVHSIVVNGTIVANGTAALPIFFRGLNGTVGEWLGIIIAGTAQAPLTGSSFDHATIRDAGWNGSGLTVEHARVSIRNSAFLNCGGSAIVTNAGGIPDVSDTSFTGSTNFAMDLQDGSVDPALARLTASGNGTNAIRIGSGTLAGPTTWEAAGIGYVLGGNVTVPSGVSLTIQPGVQMQVEGVYGIDVSGRLIAVGTQAQPIVFSGTSGTPGSWYGIQLVGGATRLTDSAIEWVSISDAGWNYAALYVEQAGITLRHVTIANSGAEGIRCWTGGVANLENVSITGSADYAMEVHDPAFDPQLTNVTATGNGTNGILLGGGSTSGNTVWEAVGLSYSLDGSLTVPVGSTLTIAPGVQVKSNSVHEILVNGRLVAAGTQTAPIVFSSKSGTRGSWVGLRIVGTSSRLTDSIVTWVTVNDAGWLDGSIYLENAEIPLRQVSIANGGGDGVRGGPSGLPHLYNVAISNNSGYAIRLADPSGDPVLDHVTANGNGADGIMLAGGSTAGDQEWENSALTYTLDGTLTIPRDSSVTIAPGVQVFANNNLSIDVNGRLVAVGNSLAPITFDSVQGTAGSWNGIRVVGPATGEPLGGTILDYVVLKHAGWNDGNLYVDHAVVTVHNSTVSGSAGDGITIGPGGGSSSIDYSSVVDNGAFGVNDQDQTEGHVVRASSNWWGSSTGPTVGNTCNPLGVGSSIQGLVEFRPFLTAPPATAARDVVPPDIATIEMKPHRWFAPADGTTRVYIDITLRDGSGNPVQGRVVNLTSNLGTATSGGLTDIDGRSYPWIQSSLAGDAEVRAVLPANNVCESSATATSRITFTNAADNALTPNEEAPYMNDGIEIVPEPITQGVPVKLRARLTNPNAVPLSVNGTFGYVDYGIGLQFGPIAEVTGKIIPANAEGVIEADWVPPLSGHYCIDFTYTATTAGAKWGINQTTSGRAQKNLDPSPMTPLTPKAAAAAAAAKRKADAEAKAARAAEKAAAAKEGDKCGWTCWWGEKKKSIDLTQHLVITPAPAQSKTSSPMATWAPRLDYTKIAILGTRPVISAVQPGNGISVARAAALSAYNDAILDSSVAEDAMLLTWQRYDGAAQAGSMLWMSQQMSALQHFQKVYGNALVAEADRLDAYLAVLQNEGVTANAVIQAKYDAFKARLNATGFDADELSAAAAFGLTSAEIEEIRHVFVDTDSSTVAGDLITLMQEESAATRDYGRALNGEQMFPVGGPGGPTGKMGGVRATIAKVARVFASETPFQVANPHAGPETIQLRARRINLPADWGVIVTPAQITLAGGATATATVQVTPGATAVQGTEARVAVEGYIGTELIGGIVVDGLVPVGVAFKKGDATGDGAVTPDDVFYLVNSLYGSGPQALGLADANGDGVVTTTDIFYLINFLFSGGSGPVE